MRKCNICGNSRPEVWYKTKNKKTCRSCERGWRGFYYRYLVQQRQLTLFQRTASRLGYMGAGFLMAGQHTLEPLLFIAGFLCVLIQVFSRKQWNLVILQLNGLIAWTIHFINQLN
tara:strand:- start:62 stop:406 length:345 start_codon:yes stop_codon:yes gene_type:complete